MKKIGIITMHRVMNVGSVLQAYALCEKIKQLGAEVEIIDYQYPNVYHIQQKANRGLIDKFLLLPLRVKYFLLYKKTIQRARFKHFFDHRMSLSKYYLDRDSLYADTPQYDIYLTGSDQVWNPACMKGDGVFFCDFVSQALKASYSASFATNEIPDLYKDIYKQYLSGYSYIGVREKDAVKLIKDIVNKDAVTVCDPTLLLNKCDYLELVNDSQLKLNKKPYILVYALSYAYDPYPRIDEVVDIVKKKLGYNVLYLHANSVDHYHMGRSITSAGPSEFIDLFLNASFIVTSSFHGTAFAINFEVPFIAIVPSSNHHDSRIESLLEILGLSKQAISTDQELPIDLPLHVDFDEARIKLDKYRYKSESFLKTIITED